MSTVTHSLQQAVRFHQSGQIDQAERMYREIVRVDPGHADALHLLGVASHQRQRNREAVDFISRAIAINGTAAMYHSNLGAAHRSSGDFETAVECFETALRLDRKFAGAHYNLAMALEALGRTTSAITSYWDAIRFDPKFLPAYNNLGSLFTSEKRPREAIKCFQMLVKADPGSARGLYNLANAYAADGQLPAAVETYRKALLFAPETPEIHNNLGVALKELNRFDEAIDAFEQALSLKPNFDEARLNLRAMPEPSGDAAEPSPPPAFESSAERERKKYEKIWTHDDYRRFSPGLHDADKVPLIDTLRRHGVRTILDAGCGTGKLMRRLITEHANEFAVHGFDISNNCLDPFFKGMIDEILTVGCLWDANDFRAEYDAIICTDVMEHIPTERVPAVLANFRRCTRNVCYLAIALFPDNFGPALLGEPLHLTVQSPDWWHSQFAAAGFKVEASGVEKSAEGRDMWLHAFVVPEVARN